MKKNIICTGCWEHMHVPIPIRSPLCLPFKLLGVTNSKMHPNLCTICESMIFTKVKKKKQVPVQTTIMFADLRGYTSLSQKIDASKMNDLLYRFYDRCSESIWESDGIVNKFIGDAVLAIFNFPLDRLNHVEAAVEAAMKLEKKCGDLKKELGLDENADIGVGVGINTGITSVGEIGTSYKEFTAVGPVVNLASRIQGYAKSGEIAITESVYDKIKDKYQNLEKRVVTIKGMPEPVTIYIIDAK